MATAKKPWKGFQRQTLAGLASSSPVVACVAPGPCRVEPRALTCLRHRLMYLDFFFLEPLLSGRGELCCITSWATASIVGFQVISVTANLVIRWRTHMHVPHSPLSKMLPIEAPEPGSGSFRSWGPQDKDQTWLRI